MLLDHLLKFWLSALHKLFIKCLKKYVLGLILFIYEYCSKQKTCV